MLYVIGEREADGVRCPVFALHDEMHFGAGSPKKTSRTWRSEGVPSIVWCSTLASAVAPCYGPGIGRGPNPQESNRRLPQDTTGFTQKLG
jgi:hypothetical protein